VTRYDDYGYPHWLPDPLWVRLLAIGSLIVLSPVLLAWGVAIWCGDKWGDTRGNTIRVLGLHMPVHRLLRR
jgi:hypothetical protein